jgi:uncharacterized protein (TIGR03067 family)
MDDDDRSSRKKKARDDDEDDSPRSKRKGRDEDDDRSSRKKKARDDDEDDFPRSKRKGRDEDDNAFDDDRPRSKRRSRDEDDDDDEPKSGFAKLKANIYVRASVLGVLLIIMGVLGYLLYDKYKNKKDDSSAKKDDDLNKPIVLDTRQPTGKKQPDNTDPKKNEAAELAKLQGTWRATKVTRAGMDAPAAILAQITFTVRGNQFFVQAPKSPPPVRFTIDTSKNPLEMDKITPAGIERSIYRFNDDDTLEICSASIGPRPTQFASPRNSPIEHMILVRVSK